MIIPLTSMVIHQLSTIFVRKTFSQFAYSPGTCRCRCTDECYTGTTLDVQARLEPAATACMAVYENRPDDPDLVCGKDEQIYQANIGHSKRLENVN